MVFPVCLVSLAMQVPPEREAIPDQRDLMDPRVQMVIRVCLDLLVPLVTKEISDLLE